MRYSPADKPAGIAQPAPTRASLKNSASFDEEQNHAIA